MKLAIYFVHDCQGRPLSRRRIFWCHWRVSLKLLVLRLAPHVAKCILVTLLNEETCFRMQVELKADMNLFVKVSAIFRWGVSFSQWISDIDRHIVHIQLPQNSSTSLLKSNIKRCGQAQLPESRKPRKTSLWDLWGQLFQDRLPIASKSVILTVIASTQELQFPFLALKRLTLTTLMWQCVKTLYPWWTSK